VRLPEAQYFRKRRGAQTGPAAETAGVTWCSFIWLVCDMLTGSWDQMEIPVMI
jgi:hypothetical protein